MNKSAIGIIGGADGPTSVFVVGQKKRFSLKRQIKNRIYKWKGMQAEKQITAGARTLAEVAAYAVEKYDAAEADIAQRKYAVQKSCLQGSLISRYRAELLGELGESISKEQLPMDFHVYEIQIGDGRLEMEIDYHWNIFGISYSGSKKNMKRMKEVARDLALYYGVSEDDIRQKTERYHSLLAILSM